MIEALNDAMTRELVLVCTPAGFGQTTLLADLGQHRGELAGCRSTPTTTIRRASGSTSSQPSIGSARASAINCCHYRAVRAGGHGAVTALINQIEA
jgi:hypothetical protein